MKQITIRVENDSAEMLAELSDKITTAAQTVIELFTYLRRGTINELRGQFTKVEIKAMSEVYKWFKPSWQIMNNPGAIVITVTNAEKHNQAISANGASLELLIPKLEALTSAQAIVLQLELINVSPDINKLIKTLS